MNQLKPMIILLTSLFVLILLVPTLLVLPFNGGANEELAEEINPSAVIKQTTGPSVEVAVYRSEAQKIEKVPLEEYVVGVVSLEMPAEFELEALKAQALAARTYIVKKMMEEENLGLPEGAHVTDTQLHQVYKSIDELKSVWGADYVWKMNKIVEAVKATEGQILTYNNKPIEASFFSTSNGYTENSEDYWSNPYPYLTAVESPWDEQSPKFYDQKTISVSEFEKKLNVKLPNDQSVGRVLERTSGKRVGTVEINDKQFTGRDVREKLELRSTDFSWVRKGNEIVITTKGYGHGVGMSQYGADGMAKEGNNYKQIIEHYYKGVTVASADTFINRMTAQK